MFWFWKAQLYVHAYSDPLIGSEVLTRGVYWINMSSRFSRRPIPLISIASVLLYSLFVGLASMLVRPSNYKSGSQAFNPRYRFCSCIHVRCSVPFKYPCKITSSWCYVSISVTVKVDFWTIYFLMLGMVRGGYHTGFVTRFEHVHNFFKIF